MYKAIVSFSGLISMREGEVREITSPELIKDLIKAKYIKKVNDKELSSNELQKENEILKSENEQLKEQLEELVAATGFNDTSSDLENKDDNQNSNNNLENKDDENTSK